VLWTALALSVAVVYVQFQPRIYSAKVTMLPSKEGANQSLSLGAALLLGAGKEGGIMSLPGMAGSAPGLSSNQDMILALLRSRTLREAVVRSHAKTWGADVGRKIVLVRPDTTEKGALGIIVEAKDPRLAAEVANRYVDELDRMLLRLSNQSGSRRQAAYTAQLERAAKAVEIAEEDLLKFQSENRVLLSSLDGPTKGAVDSTVALRGSIMSLEMQREVMRLRYTDRHPQMQEIDKQISELKSQYSKNLFGGAMDLPPESPSARGALRKEFFVPAAKMTPVQFSLLKLYRNLKMQEAFYTGALQGLQQIQYGSDDNAPQVELLDPAEPSPTPVRPNIPFTAAVGAVVGLVAGVIFTFVREYVRLTARERGRQSSPMPEVART
jgi:hypothetical protein